MLPMCLKSCNGLLLLLFVYVDASAGMGKFLGADPFSFENAMNALTLTVTQQSLHSNNTQSTKRNCFKHQMTETHDFFQQGEVWEICVAQSVPENSLAPKSTPTPAAVPATALTHPPEKMIPLIKNSKNKSKNKNENKNTMDSRTRNINPSDSVTFSDDTHITDKARRDTEDTTLTVAVAVAEAMPVAMTVAVTTEASIVLVQVDPSTPDAPANSSHCNAEDINVMCNFRSAVAYCDEVLRSANNQQCTILLPPSEPVIMSAAHGEILLQNVPPGQIRVEGSGSVVSPSVAAVPSNQSCRLLNIQNDPSKTGFHFLLMNVTIARFGYWTLDGGAVSITNAAFHTDTVRFVSNMGASGGAVAITKSQNISFVSTDFEFNRAGLNGGGVFVLSQTYDVSFSVCSFISNSAPQGGGGGAYLLEDNHFISFSSSLFRNNSAYRGGGLNVFQDHSNISLTDVYFSGNVAINTVTGLEISFRNVNIILIRCHFIRNVADFNGGALRLYDGNNQIQLIECEFSKNIAGYGAGLAVFRANYNFLIRNCTFVGNLAKNEGDPDFDGAAGIAMGNGNFEITIEDTTFANNTVQHAFGGGISFLFDNYAIKIANCTFKDNVAIGGNGGALYFDKDNADISIISTNFSDNRAKSGGSLYFHSETRNLVLFDLRIVGNIASREGGGIVFMVDNENVLVDQCFFQDNVAGDTGGAIQSSLANSGMIIRASSFLSCVAGLYGGALYIGEDHDVLTFDDSDFINNVAVVSGGAVVITRFNNKAKFTSCLFDGNIGVETVGALVSYADVTFLSLTHVTNNAAVGGYAGVTIERGDVIWISDCVFRNNSMVLGGVDISGQSGRGGGLTVMDARVVRIFATVFEDNSARRYGGGLYLDGNNRVLLENSTFRNNRAQYGAALDIYQSRGSTLEGLVFEDNVATAGGCVSVFECFAVNITASTFIRNVVLDGFGSAVYAEYSTISLHDNLFEENRVDWGAGTVYWIHSSMPEPTGLRSDVNVFASSNNATYGPNWATEAVSLVISNGSDYSHTAMHFDVVDYNRPAPSFTATVKDFYEQDVLTESRNFVQLSVPENIVRDCKGFSAFVGGEIVQYFERGQVNFSDVDAFCAPGGFMSLNASTALVSTAATFQFSFRECVRGEYFADRQCNLCDDGFYSLTDPSTVKDLTELEHVCKDCPAEASECHSDQMVAKEGYWRINGDAESFLTCPWAHDSCLGVADTGDEACGSSYEGPLCGVCIHNHYYSSSTDTCEDCASALIDGATLTVLMVVILCCCYGLFFFQRTLREQKVESFDDFAILIFVKFKLVDPDIYTNCPQAINENISTFNHRLRARLKTYVIFYQVVASLSFVLNYDDLPPLYSRVASLGSVVNIDISQTSFCSCFFGGKFDFIDRLLFDTIYPVVVLAILYFIYRCHSYLKYSKSSNVTNDNEQKNQMEILHGRYFEIYLLFIYIILPSLTARIFQTFSCRSIDPDDVDDGDNYFLRADYSISCHSSRYYFIRVWASLMIFVYPVLVPMYYFRLLYMNKVAIQAHIPYLVDSSDEGRVLKPFKFLFSSYKPMFWYWESVEIFFRLTMTGFLVLAAYLGGVGQLLIGFFLAFFFVKLYENFEPYHDSMNGVSKIITLWEICLIFLYIILLKADFISSQNQIFPILLMVLILGTFCWDFFRIVHDFLVKTSADNEEALLQRERSISDASTVGVDACTSISSPLHSRTMKEQIVNRDSNIQLKFF